LLQCLFLQKFGRSSHVLYPWQALKQNRNNWRAWVSKLYVTLDLEKYDEAIQACNMLLDFQKTHSTAGVPALEEKCVRAIVGGTLKRYQEACQLVPRQHQSQPHPHPQPPSADVKNVEYRPSSSSSNAERSAAAAMESARRSLTRVHDLLERLTATIKDPWIFETVAFFHANLGKDEEQIHANLMKEYRSLQSVRGWEKDDIQVERVCRVVSQIVRFSLEAQSSSSSSSLIRPQPPLTQIQEGEDEVEEEEKGGNDKNDSSDNDEKRKVAKARLATSKFLLSGVIQRIRKSRLDPTKMPDQVMHLETLLQNISQHLS
jgi:hypothetical protein